LDVIWQKHGINWFLSIVYSQQETNKPTCIIERHQLEVLLNIAIE